MSSAIQRYPGLDKILEKHTDQVGGRYLNQKKRHFIKKKSSLSPHSQYWRKKYHKYRHKVKMLEGGSQAGVDTAQARAQAPAIAAQKSAIAAKKKQEEIDKRLIKQLNTVLQQVLPEFVRQEKQESSSVQTKILVDDKLLQEMVKLLNETVVGPGLPKNNRTLSYSLAVQGEVVSKILAEQMDNKEAEEKGQSSTKCKQYIETKIKEIKKSITQKETDKPARLDGIPALCRQVISSLDSKSSDKSSSVVIEKLQLMEKLANGIWDAENNLEQIKAKNLAQKYQFKLQAIKQCVSSCQNDEIKTSKVGKAARKSGFFSTGVLGFFSRTIGLGQHETMTYGKMIEKLDKLYAKVWVRLKKFEKITKQLKLGISTTEETGLVDINALGQEIRAWLETKVSVPGISKPKSIDDTIRDSIEELVKLYKELREEPQGASGMFSKRGRSIKAGVFGIRSKNSQNRQAAKQIMQSHIDEQNTTSKKQTGGSDLESSKMAMKNRAKVDSSGTWYGNVERWASGIDLSAERKEMEDANQIKSSIDTEGNTIFTNMLLLQETLQDIQTLPMFKFHPIFAAIPKKLTEINTILTAIPSQADKFEKKHTSIFKGIKEYKEQIEELMGAIEKQELQQKKTWNQITRKLLPKKDEVSQGQELWDETKPIGVKITPQNAERELITLSKYIDERVKVLSKKLEAGKTDKQELVEEKLLMDCLGCTDYAMTKSMFTSIFENAINNSDCVACLSSEGTCAGKTNCPQNCTLPPLSTNKPQDCQLLQLVGDTNHYGRFAFIYYTYGEQAAKIYTSNSDPAIQIASLWLRQACMEKACLFLRDYIIHHVPDKARHIDFSHSMFGPASLQEKHGLQISEIDEAKTNHAEQQEQEKQKQQAVELQNKQEQEQQQQQAIAAAEQRGQAHQAATQAKQEIETTSMFGNKTSRTNTALTNFNDNHAGKLPDYQAYQTQVRNTMNVPLEHNDNVLTLDEYQQKRQEYVQQNSIQPS